MYFLNSVFVFSNDCVSLLVTYFNELEFSNVFQIYSIVFSLSCWFPSFYLQFLLALQILVKIMDFALTLLQDLMYIASVLKGLQVQLVKQKVLHVSLSLCFNLISNTYVTGEGYCIIYFQCIRAFPCLRMVVRALYFRGLVRFYRGFCLRLDV